MTANRIQHANAARFLSKPRADQLPERPLWVSQHPIVTTGVSAPPSTAGSPSPAVQCPNAPQLIEAETDGTIRTLEMSGEQKNIEENEGYVDEVCQSANHQLLLTKEKLQSLNVELTATNVKLQEALERLKTRSNTLQNVLYSTAVATLFLDRDLNIRLFTPAAELLFNIVAADVGRPLADINSHAVDGTLLNDAAMVLGNREPLEHEIVCGNGAWYLRRVRHYIDDDNGLEGVVITFADVTHQHMINEALQSATRKANVASASKSRFLAVASHDLRQPLQTLGLLQGLLVRKTVGQEPQKLLALVGDSLGTMSGMLNALLDVNQIEAGIVKPQTSDFRIQDLLTGLRAEFGVVAQAKGLDLRVVDCSLIVRTDPHLLEQMVRNLLSNAFKYTKSGKVLLGCRRRGNMASIEIWDTGIGIAAGDVQSIFAEYRQLDNDSRDCSKGLGLGLSIVQRLGDLLGHTVKVRSCPSKGSVFTIKANLAAKASLAAKEGLLPLAVLSDVDNLSKSAAVAFVGYPRLEPALILSGQPDVTSVESTPDQGRTETVGARLFVIDDDDQLLRALRLVLEKRGLSVETYASCEAFLKAGHARDEGCLLVDGYLPGMDGLELLQTLQENGQHLQSIMMTGSSDVALAVKAMKAGASDFIEKPFNNAMLLASVDKALERAHADTRRNAVHDNAAKQIGSLTTRQREIMHLVLAGHPSKNIAADLHISQRTVENHRATIMSKTGSKSLPALSRLAMAASDDRVVLSSFG